MQKAQMTSDDVDALKSELARDDLQIYAVVVMAARDLKRGDLDSAIARLRVDADKLRCHETRINEFLAR